MRMIFTRFSILCKKAWKSPLLWVELILFACSLYLVSHTIIPSAENLTVAVVNESGDAGHALEDALITSGSAFTFVPFESEEAMEHAVHDGSAECGLIITEDYERRVMSDHPEDLLILVTSNYTTKKAIVRETVFAVFLRLYSEKLLTDSAEEWFTSPEAKDAILTRNAEYLSGDEIFRVDYHIVDDNGEEAATEHSAAYPIRGLVVLLIYIHLLMVHGGTIGAHEGIEKAMSRRERIGFGVLRDLAEGMPLMLIGWIVIMVCDRRIEAYAELLLLCGYLLMTILWVTIFAALFRRRESYLSWSVAVILLGMVICPIFTDLSGYLTGLSQASMILPLGSYFNFLKYLL